MTTTIQKTVLWCLIILVVSSSVLGLGIRPAKSTVNFEETQVYEKTIWVVNGEEREVTMDISVEGEMAQFVSIDNSKLTFKETDDALPIQFTVTLPDEIPPGRSTAYIVVSETKESSISNVVSSKIVLKHKIMINGPYPEKYVTVKLNFHDTGNELRFVSEVENKGKKPIGTLQTTFYVNDKKQQEHALTTVATGLNTAENKLLDARLEKSVLEQGEFEVLAVTTYDDQTVEVVKKLLVGLPEVEVTYFDAYFTAFKINQYSMDLLNKWNTMIKNVFVEVDVKKNGEKVDHFRTKSVDIESEVTERIVDYFDATEKNPGTYTFDMIVHFWNTYKMDTKTFESVLLEDGEVKAPIVEEVLTGNVVEEVPQEESSIALWIGAVAFIFIIGIVVAIVVIIRRRRQQDFTMAQPQQLQEQQVAIQQIVPQQEQVTPQLTTKPQQEHYQNYQEPQVSEDF